MGQEDFSSPDFITIDFETATPDMDSACSIGIAIVSNLKVVDQLYTLIQPPNNEYDPRNSEIHGLSAPDTKHSPPAWKVLSPLVPILESGVPVVAHNATFDMSVLYHCFGSIPDFKYMDTMDMVRPFEMFGNSLDNCAKFFGITLEHHHNALDDAVACAQIAIACVEQSPFQRFSDYCLYSSYVKIHQFSKLNPIKTMRPKVSRPQHHFETIRPSEIIPTVSTIDQTNPLYGKSIVFTGELSIARQTAAQIAVNAGAIIKTGVSRKTDYLVVGIQDKQLVGEDGLSSKEEKAYELNNSGKGHIEIIDESEFLQLANQEVLL